MVYIESHEYHDAQQVIWIQPMLGPYVSGKDVCTSAEFDFSDATWRDLVRVNCIANGFLANPLTWSWF